MENYSWFIILVSLNSLLLVSLALNVSRLRLKYRISFGDGNNRQLLKAIRAHANLSEQLPIFSLLVLALTFIHTSSFLLMMFVSVFTLSRISHAAGVIFSFHKARRIGAALTYLLQVGAAIALLVGAFA